MDTKGMDWRVVACVAGLLLLAVLAVGGIQFVKVNHPDISPQHALPADINVSEGESGSTAPPSSGEGETIPQSIETESAAPEALLGAVQEPPATAPDIAVAIAGEVNAPGFYRMPADSRVQELITKARGVTDFADMSDINIAAKLVDGTTLTIPGEPKRESAQGSLVLRKAVSAADVNPPCYTRSGWRAARSAPDTPEVSETAVPMAAEAAPPTSGKGADGLIDLNTAAKEELDTLPGIGPKTAEKIIEYRNETPFTSVDDLNNIHGIGEKKLDAIRKFVTVR